MKTAIMPDKAPGTLSDLMAAGFDPGSARTRRMTQGG
jgi:hypothetical protein